MEKDMWTSSSSSSPGHFHFLTAIIILILPGFASGQQCLRLVQSTWRNPCPHYPYFLREAFTLEKSYQNETKFYLKVCCDPRGVMMLRARATGCQTTACLTPTHPNYQTPCTSFKGRFIVEGNFINYEESMRDDCVEEETGEQGTAAVCCPPNSKANILLSMYGVEKNEFPHQARLQSEVGMCGATVYNKDFVITAAHCVVDQEGHVKSPEKMNVTLGTSLANMKSKANVFHVEKIIVHEKSSMMRNNSEFWEVPFQRIYNDIALVKLARSIDFHNQSKIRALPVAPLGFKPEDHADNVVIVGWGTTDTGGLSEHLHKANLLIHEDSECFQPYLGFMDIPPYPNTQEFSDQLICVGGILNGEASPVAGQGDSGGPAICRGEDAFAVHCGITSFGGSGELCQERRDEMGCRPTVVADVSYFREWIEKNAGLQDPESLHKMKLYGDIVPENEAVHQVKVISKDGAGIECGGTLVSRDVVVTAGHCVFSGNDATNGPKVRDGIQIETRNGTVIKARKEGGVTGLKTFQRKNFYNVLNERRSGGKSFEVPPYADDIAVIKLEDKVPYGEEKLAKLPSSGDSSQGEFNATELSYSNTRISGNEKPLVKRDFRILNSSECQRRLDIYKSLGVKNEFDPQKTLCGVENYSGGGICDRRLGGGLVCNGKNNNADGGNGNDNNELCGVQTFRFCDSSLPNVFQNVKQYQNLIEEAVKKP